MDIFINGQLFTSDAKSVEEIIKAEQIRKRVNIMRSIAEDI